MHFLTCPRQLVLFLKVTGKSIPYKKGTIIGPELDGEIIPTSADWFIMRPDGTIQLDVRVLIRTDDGALVYSYYRGILKTSPDVMKRLQNNEDVDPLEYYFRTMPVFETGAEKFKWLNQVVAVGIGSLKFVNDNNNIYILYKIYEIL